MGFAVGRRRGSAMFLAHHRWKWPASSRSFPIRSRTLPLSLGFDLIALVRRQGVARSGGTAQVRDILPSSYSHVNTLATSHLHKNEEVRKWINDFRPDVDKATPRHYLWAGPEVFDRRHWVLQALIRARRAQPTPWLDRLRVGAGLAHGASAPPAAPPENEAVVTRQSGGHLR